MTNAFTKKIFALAFAVSALTVATSPAWAMDDFTMIPNAGIPGHNQETHHNVGVQSCLQLCSGRSWCMSADYERATQKCFLQPVSKGEATLRTDYPGNPYDHYHNNDRLTEQLPHNARPAPKTATAPKVVGQCGKRLTITGAGAKGLVYELKKNRAERRAERAWRSYVAGESSPSSVGGFLGVTFGSTTHPSYGLGTRYADLDNARDVVMNCDGGGTMHCTVTATPCAG